LALAPPTSQSVLENKSFLLSIGQSLARVRRFFFHPVSIFVVLQLVCVVIAVMWVVWYANKSNININFTHNFDLIFLTTGVSLLGIILAGNILLFIFAIKQSRLNQQQRTFVSSVTHELRSPIASIQLSLETILSRKLTKTISTKMHNMMLSDLERLVKLVDQILVSARLDRGIKIFEQVETFSVADMIESVKESASHLDRNLGNRLKVTCPQDFELNTARPALNLIISNLVENAIKYSPPNSPIDLVVEVKAKEILFSVKDKGIGLEKGENRRIFKMFHRSKHAAKKAIPGTGLGLYIVKTVVKVLGGKVWADSSGIGLGSTFYVSLPLKANRS
jgi:signal transduction histidine kinase